LAANGFWRTAHGVCLLLFLLCLPGCGGCRKTPDAAEKSNPQAKKKEKPKERFEAHAPAVMPSSNFAGDCKPGHWISQVWPDVKANFEDFQGELHTDVEDSAGHKLRLPAAAYELTSQRPVALAKEQPKSLETIAWIQEKARTVSFKLTAGGGPAMIERGLTLTHMPSYCYFFVVLSKPAGRYDYLGKKLPSIRPIADKTDVGSGPERYYDVVSMPPSKRPSLPARALCWTSIAYLLWDDFDPTLCDADQQRALVDWLYWGGQVIVSGPDALQQLRNSFLGPYLPATVEKSRNLSAGDLAQLQYWDGEFGNPPVVTRPWQAAILKKDPHGRFLPYTDDLVAERQVGRGRIVATAFRLSGPELTDWRGFDCFFNACLLRRSARLFPADSDADMETASAPFRWADGKANSHPLDAAKMTAVRYFVRDTGVDFAHYASDMAAEKLEQQNAFSGTSVPSSNTDDRGYAPGLGAWNDYSPVAQEARMALNHASRITVPERRFILWVVLGYLCVLVPANWIVFRFLGRVEWTWIAAPLIAIACTAVVIQQAQLNIGFARSQSEIAVIEMQPGYSRVHVAHYAVLYTSLATRYEFHVADPGGQILPFPRDASPEQFKMDQFGSIGELVCRRGDDTQLTGFNIGSNVADFVHSEEMADIGGTVTFRRDNDGTVRVTNATRYPLNHCRAVRATANGSEMATIGALAPGETKDLMFHDVHRPVTDKTYDHTFGDDSGVVPRKIVSQLSDPAGELSVAGIEEVALNSQEFRPAEICLVARIEGPVPGLSVSPAAEQSRQAALLVTHFYPDQLPEPRTDRKVPNTHVQPSE
jgi:hypothetical protein